MRFSWPFWRWSRPSGTITNLKRYRRHLVQLTQHNGLIVDDIVHLGRLDHVGRYYAWDVLNANMHTNPDTRFDIDGDSAFFTMCKTSLSTIFLLVSIF